ncbi:hypothetical protein BFJ69_g12179 [Fusarium oxysporum]|uniref:Aminoglycoside phosphotransferase domain-containing protein n=1 Tax=Fusarium oxysporum TaxID=5507 RepID=A0A420MPW6_FUSOX|nr:hypothetical protein BFJ69_g12179 [Fusarium oxysporum]
MSKRLQEMMRREKRIAIYGDSPPPPKTAAPYPEGEVIYKCTERYIVRHGNTVTKYAIHPDGMGVNDKPNEALVLQFIKENTTIPVPEVISSDWDRIELEYIEGQTLKEAWPSLEPHERTCNIGPAERLPGTTACPQGIL